MQLSAPPRDSRFGSPLQLSKVRPEVVVEVTYLTWTEDSLLRQSRITVSEKTSLRGRSCGRCRIRLEEEEAEQLRCSVWHLVNQEPRPVERVANGLSASREGRYSTCPT